MHFDNSDPIKAAPVSGWFYARKIRQLDKPSRRNLYAEPPSFRGAGLEIGELLPADRVDEKIARLTVQRFPRAGKPATERFELSGIHERAFRLTNQAPLSDKPGYPLYVGACDR
jgi:hypothetical protein